MTPKERWLAAVHMKPVDRLPFWPKLNTSYPRAQAPPFCDMTIDEIHDWIGSDKHKGISGCVREVRKHTSVETFKNNGRRTTVHKTPHGEMTLTCKFDEPSQSWHPVEHPVKTPGDIELMTEIFSDVTVELDEDALEKSKGEQRDVGNDAITNNGIGESPLMHWVEWMAGIEMAHYLLADCRENAEALFDAMHAVLLRKAEVLAENSPADVLYMTENTSTTLISPEQYRDYCYRHITEYGNIARSFGKPLILHMCGHLKALLPDLAQVPAEAFEAFTSPTLGNTRLIDGRTACPGTCLIGGTNAVLWTKSAGDIIAEIERDLEDLPHHRGVVVTSAGVMPPMCKPETIREVCGWVKAYPARM